MTLLVKSSKGGLRLYTDLKVLNFFLGVSCFTFVRTFRYPRNSYVGKANPIHDFFVTFYCTLKTVNF